MNGNRAVTLAAATAVASTALLLSGCSATDTPALSPSTTESTFEHIHELVVDERDGTLLVATHEGLYRLTVDSTGSASAAGPIGGLDFDPMGFTIADSTAYASGHPGPTTPASFGSPNLGLITSSDAGETWTNVSLTGVTDFHGLTVSASGGGLAHVFGYDASKGAVVRSVDGGATWSDGATLAARDILAVGNELLATTADGLAVSTDDGVSFSVDTDAPKLFVIAADDTGTIAGVDTTGTLWTHSMGQDWIRGLAVTGVPRAFAVDGTRMYVADDRGIAFTDDAGATWTVLTVHT